ncbi:MAG: hypothetical protein O9301_10045 [Leptospira sp.]|nr:hypothetical protein [Leptospira sp.]
MVSLFKFFGFSILTFSLIRLPILAAPDPVKPNDCRQKISTVETIYELLPETSKSCEEIAKIVIQDEDEDGNQIQPEYKELFLTVCGWKKQGKSLPEMKQNLGLPNSCPKK